MLGSFVVFQGIHTSIAKRPYIFVIIQEGGSEVGDPRDGLFYPALTCMVDFYNLHCLASVLWTVYGTCTCFIKDHNEVNF